MNALPKHEEFADAHLEYRARLFIRQLRQAFGSGGARELLNRIQNDEDERTGR